MKKIVFSLIALIVLINTPAFGIDAWIRINQLGYMPNDQKKAILISETPRNITSFQLLDALTYEKVAEYKTITEGGGFGQFVNSWILDFSGFKKQGAFFIQVGDVYSPTIYINKNIYVSTADSLLNFLRLQRCGVNPVLSRGCHRTDGFEARETSTRTSNNTLSSRSNLIDVTGGWHNGADNIKFGATSAVTVYQLLFAYQQYPTAFGDYFDAAGKPGSNGIPDILDEAKWGLEWLVKMCPRSQKIYHQVGDDRDHTGFTMPYDDKVNYGRGAGNGRPVYQATGEVQGLFSVKNNSTGIASIAGKYSSAFALGAAVLAPYAPEFAKRLEEKAVETYQVGKENAGVCQAVPANSPLFMKEENWVDDMELAAIQLFHLTYDHQYVEDAAGFGRREPVTPWLFSGTTEYYQWYPFVNIGHYMLAKLENPVFKKEFTENLRMGLERMNLNSKTNVFRVSVPMSWGSNNLVIALATQCQLYRELTNDNQFLEMENALIDWLLGLNPWGTSMIVGLPYKNGQTPSSPHSALWVKERIRPCGGVVSGAISREDLDAVLPNFNPLYGDQYSRFQSDWATYYDEVDNFATNEVTIDRTSALSVLLAQKQYSGVKNKTGDKNIYSYGGITQTDPEQKRISLIFSGHAYADGAETIRKTLLKHNVKASFFFTGDFYRNSKYSKYIKSLKKDGHYLGAHSDKNTLYCSWENRDQLLVSKNEFVSDLQQNFSAMKKFRINKEDAPFFLPPFQWYNDEVSAWCKESGMQLVSFTSGTYTNADYTIPEMRESYYSSQEIYNKVLQIEQEKGLNGYIMFFNIGTDERRADKFYDRLDDLLYELKNKGYEFVDLYKSTDAF